ncbi:MAG TPA: inositol monophosphatase family protein, partial [Nitrospinaceae bacterium]|nr:inositol monophosphatase family protein [Nitrospinaceae bacterium]
MSQLNLPDPEKISEFLREAAERDILPLFKQLKDHEINDKESGEIVTAADIRAENRLINSLTKVLPKSTTVGEEEVSGDKSVINRLTGEAPVWVIDPLDGTRNFSKGKDRFAVIVALCLQG